MRVAISVSIDEDVARIINANAAKGQISRGEVINRVFAEYAKLLDEKKQAQQREEQADVQTPSA
jgi:metal-responsive CopG/Arc/MetJ family transcriptional regulator